MNDDEDINNTVNYKSVTCKNIPEQFLDKLIAKKYFGKFGKIKRFILRPKQRQCTVDYESKSYAQDAFLNAGLFNGHEFLVTYTDGETAHMLPNTEEWLQADVQAELEAMKNTSLFPQRSQKVPNFPKQQEQKPLLKVPKSRLQTENEVNSMNIKNELEATVRRQGVNDEEKYRILDARDKLIRLSTVRTTDIKSAVSTKGTCPDMCPEKERLMREYQHQVSVFEMDSSLRSALNHKLAIKEYSRSSADQEVPLSHELRSEPILKMTMTYLLHKIMDLCEDDQINKGDWYHFVWDRTRSIRKDITQQELCSLNSVELVEQCARFHIHCAARLVAEHSADFDQKINTENLTKCLQTLKYMYNDLRIKNVDCPNESEFRSYIILLNLSDGNFLWEMNQLPEVIVKSKEVKMAMAFYFAMESNNYVKFFKLVKQTTYLSACLLLRYFTQIRVRALSTIIKAYTRNFLPKDSISVPLTYLTDILGYDSIDDAVSMFRYYGLNCDEGKVHLDRQAFSMPELNYPMECSILIESKRNDSVGTTICGKVLESLAVFENHVIHESFDENGYLKPEALNAEDQLRGEDAKKRKSLQKQSTPLSDSVFKIPFASKQQHAKSLMDVAHHDNQHQATKDTIDSTNLFNLKPNINTNKLFGNSSANLFTSSTENSSTTKNSLLFCNTEKTTPTEKSFSGNIFGAVEPTTVTTIASKVFDLPKSSVSNNTNNTRNIFERLDNRNIPFTENNVSRRMLLLPQVMESNDPIYAGKESDNEIKANEIEKNIEAELINKKKIEEENHKKQLQIEKQKLQLEQSQEREQQLIAQKEIQKGKYAVKLFDDILCDIINDEVSKISTQIMRNRKKIEKDAQIYCNYLLDEFITDEIINCCNNQIAIKSRHLELLEKYLKRWQNRTRRSIQQRQLIESMPSWLVPDSLDDRASPWQNETLHYMRRYRLGIPVDCLNSLPKANQPKINIIDILSKQFELKPENATPRPGYLHNHKYFKFIMSIPGEHEESPGFNSFINNWFEKNINFENHKSNDHHSFICQSSRTLSLAVRKISEINGKNEIGGKVGKECDHADGILFLMTSCNYRNSCKRLHNIFNCAKIYKEIPIVIIVYNDQGNKDVVERELDLVNLQTDGIISYYSISGSTEMIEEISLRSLFEEGLKFLAQKDESKCDLEMQTLTSFLASTVGYEMFQQFFESCQLNPLFQKICTEPIYVVQIYNELIYRLLTFLDIDLNEHPEFPEELRQFVPKRLSDIPCKLEHFDVDWKHTNRLKRIQNFVKKLKLPKISEERPNEIDKLEHWLFDYASNCINGNELAGGKLGFAAIKTLLERLNNSAVCDLPVSNRLQLISWMGVFQTITLGVLNYVWSIEFKTLPNYIYYNRNDYMKFFSNPWWLNTDQLKSLRVIIDEQEELETSKENQNPELELDIDELIAKGNAAIIAADKKLTKYKKRSPPTIHFDESINESLYKFEIDKIMHRIENASGVDKEIDVDQLSDTPKKKKFKGDNYDRGDAENENDKWNLERILTRAQSVINRVEKRTDNA